MSFGKILLVLLVIVIVSFSFLCIFFPQIPIIDELIASLSEIDFNTNIGDVALNINFHGGFPSFEISQIEYGNNAIVMRTFSISIFVIIFLLVMLFLSSRFSFASFITTIFCCIMEWNLAWQTMDFYKALVAQGNTTWQAAKACFWTTLIMFLIIIAWGALGWSKYIREESDNFWGGFALSLFMAISCGFLAGAIIAGLSHVFLGCGWAGGIIVMFIFTIWYSMFVNILFWAKGRDIIKSYNLSNNQ